jgi:hypothetical protein
MKPSISSPEPQPIETAPRDGTRVDLYDAKRKLRAPDCYWHRKGERWNSKWHDREGYSALRLPFNATHWMPLPPLPEKSK